MIGAEVGVTGVTLAYQRRVALTGIDGRFAAGSLTAVIGPNGAGKSSVIKAIAGVLKPSAGRIDVTGALAYLPQRAEIERGFPIGTRDMVLLGLWRRLGWHRAAGPVEIAQAEAALATVGLDPGGDRPIGELSAGQFQRALFARLILQDAPLILLDEPFTAMDARTIADLLALIETWHRQGRTIITVLHDLDQVRRYFPQTLLLARRQIAWGPTETVLTEANLAAARALADAWSP